MVTLFETFENARLFRDETDAGLSIYKRQDHGVDTYAVTAYPGTAFDPHIEWMEVEE